MFRSLIQRGGGNRARPIALCTVSAMAMAAASGLPWPGSEAQAACATSTAAGTVTVNCATTATSNTTNTNGNNPATTDRVQQFPSNIVGTVNAGATVSLNGLQLQTTTAGSTLTLTNNGAVSTNQNLNAVQLDTNGAGNFGLFTYSGTGTISNTNASAGSGALNIANLGTGAISATISNTATAIAGNGLLATTGSGSVTVNVQAAGTLQGTNGLFVITTGTNTLTNAGTITGVGVGLSGVNSSGNIGVTNSGTISGNGFGINSGGGVTLGSTGGSITGTGAGSVGIRATNLSGNNAGLISGVSNGVLASGSVNLTTNSATIQGTNNSGINATGDVTLNNTGAGTITSAINGILGQSTATITNSGTITGTTAATSFGINFVGNGTVTNSGNISGGDAGVFGGQGVNLLTVNNNSGGTITGTNASVRGGSLNVTNAGNLAGSVVATVGAVTLNNQLGGSITANASGTTGVVATGTASITNAGSITANQAGISVLGGSANIANSGTITATATTGSAINTAAAGTLTLVNSGTISETGTSGFAVFATSGDVNVTSNSGTISGGTAIRSDGGNITVTNTGTGIIQATSANGAGISGVSGTVTLINAGTVSGSGSSGAVAGNFVILNNSGNITGTNTIFGTIFLAGGAGSGATISNSGNITATGAASFAIFGSGPAVVNVTANSGNISATGANSIGIVAAGLTVTNNVGGTISGGLDGINQQRNTATSITNAGTISGAGRSGVRLANNATVVNTGTITGLAGIVFRDPTGTNTPVVNGSVFNSGTITGTGGTAINFAATPLSGPFTLTLGPGSVINGNVLGTGGDTFQLGGVGSDTFNLGNIGAAQQYRGFTAFNKIGSSTWTVTGTGNQAWTVQGGNFLVNGTINGAVNVTGGLLGGSGAVGATGIANGATLSPGSNGIGTLTVNGNLTLQSASLYLFGVTGSAAGRTTVTGSAAVAGTAQAVFQGSSFQSQYTILSAAGGRNGTFGNLIVTNLPGFFNASLVYTPTEVDLKLTSGLGQTTGLTGNQTAVAAGIDNGINSGGGFLTGLAGVAPGQFGAALNALSGEGLSGTQETALGTGDTFLTAMMEQGAFWRSGESGSSGAAAMNYAPEKPVPAVFKAMPKGMLLKAPVFEPRWRAWAAGFDGAWSLQGEAAPGSADLTHRSAGGAAGVDYQVAPDLLVGAAAGGSASTFSVPDRSTSGTLDGAHAGAYAVARRDGWYTAASVGFAAFSNKTSRTIAGVGPTETATASFNSNLLSGRLELGLEHRIGGFAVTPFAAVQFAQLWQAGFSESSTTAAGGPGVLGLTVPSRSVSSLPTFAGLQVDNRMALANGMIWTPYARVAWVHEFDPSRAISASFITLPGASFTVDGPRAARDAARIDAGSKLAISRSVSLFGSLDGELSARSQMYAGKGGVQVDW